MASIRSRFPIRTLNRQILSSFSHHSPSSSSSSRRVLPNPNDATTPRRFLPWGSYPRVFFSASPVDLGPTPSPVDYGSDLEEEEFHRLADRTIENLQERLEEYGDEVQVDGFDIDYGNQVLTLKLGDLGTYVINKQTPNRQIWLSSPVSGPSRFDWDRTSQAWVYRRNKEILLNLLQSELKQLCGHPIDFS